MVGKLFTNSLEAPIRSKFPSLDGLEVSAHIFVDRAGEITQYVPFNMQAWHAGVSCYGERTNCNDFSIGIEIEGTDVLPYTDKQYVVLSDVVVAILRKYPTISIGSIVGHMEIAPERKTDPGRVFDWKRLYSSLTDRMAWIV